MSNRQPLDPELSSNIDPFTTASLTGQDAHTGIYLDVDPQHSSVLIQTNDTNAVYIDQFQNMGINTISPSAQLDINSASGSCIQLTYNGSQTNKATMSVSSDGKLLLSAGGSEVNVDTSTNFNVKSHNGLNAGLMLANSLVQATADQLNFNVVTPGTASNSKSLVLNNTGSISGINSLSAVSLSGTLQTTYQPNVESVNVLDVTGHTGAAGLSLGGTLVTSTAQKLNYVDTSPGMAEVNKALVLDGNRDVSNINALSAAKLSGTIQTAAQPNITSLGTLTSLAFDGPLTGLVELSINTTETGRTLVVNNETGNCFRMYYDAATSAANYADMLVDGFGNLSLTTSGGNVDITSHDGGSQGLKLGSVLVTATADQINYLQGTTPGNVTAGKAMIIDSNRNVANINALTAVNLTGTLQTGAQPNISSVNALNISTHDGGSFGLKLNGTLVTATAAELNYVDTTPGAAEANKALVLDGQKDISGIHALSADELTGTLQTAAQPNVTSVGTLSSLSVAGNVTMGSTTISESEIAVVDGVVAGVASAGKALVVDSSKNITEINALSASELTGTLQTAAQPNISSVTTLNITGANGSTLGLELGGSLVTATAEELNYVDTTPGTAAASKALVLDASKNIENINSLSAVDLTGTLQTAAQPNVTSVGTLSSLSVAGNVTMGSTTISESEIGVLDGVVPGTVSASKALVVDADKNISTLNTLTANNLTATNVTGTLQTGAQPNITSVTTLDITGANGVDSGLKLGGVLLTATADQINSIFGAGGQGTFQNLTVNDTLTLANADGTGMGLVLGETLVTADGTELNYLDGSVPGTVVASKAVVVDENKDISSFRNLTATNLTGTLQTAAQPNVTSVGTLSSLSVAGNVTMGSTTISESEIATLDGVTAGTAKAGKALVVDSSKSIGGIANIGSKTLTLTGDGTAKFQNWTQSNVTSKTINQIAYSPSLNIYIAAIISDLGGATLNYVYKSSDGVTWTTVNVPVSGYWSGVVWFPDISKFILTTQTGKFLTSPDGLIWTEIGNFSAPNFKLTYSASRAAVYAYKVNGSAISYTLDGLNWLQLSSAGNAAAYHPNKIITSPSFVMFAASGTTNGYSEGSMKIRYQFGSSNADLTNTATVSTFGSSRIEYIMEYSPELNRLVALARDATSGINAVAYLSNPTSSNINSGWVSANLPFGERWTEIKWSKTYNGFVAVGGSPIKLIYSEDGISWSQITGLPTLNGNIDAMHGDFIFNDDVLIIAAAGYTGSVGLAKTTMGTPAVFTMGTTAITEPELAVLDAVTAGTASTSKALVVDSSKNISGINSLSATSLTGTLQTAAQPNVTSVGTLSSLSVAGNVTMGSTTINESELAVLDGVTAGTVTASKAVVVDANKDISSFRNLTATNLTGTLQTADQPNVTSVNNLDITAHDGSSVGLKLGGVLVESTAAELNYNHTVTPGTVLASHTVVVDGNKDISSFRNLTSVTLTSTSGSLTMGGTNISESEIAVLDSVVAGSGEAFKAVVLDTNKDISGIHALSADSLTSTAGSLTMGSTAISEGEIAVLDGVVAGATSASKALVVDSSKDISGIHALSADSLTSTAGSLTMGSTAISESEIATLDGVVAGVVSASKAVVVDENKDISSFRNLTAINLTGTLQTADQPNITSVGQLESLDVDGDVSLGGDLTIGSTLVTSTTAAWLSDATPGTALPYTALVLDSSKNITSINSLTSTNLTATNLTGTIQTAAQPNISSVNVLDVTAHDGATQGLKLGGVLLTATATQINSIFGDGGEGTFNNLVVNENLTLAGADGSSMGLVLGETLVTSTGTELNYVDTTPGHAQPLKALVFDANVDIDSINSLSASKLTGTIQTAAQPNISSVNVLDVTAHDGATQGLKLGGVLLTATATQINSIFGEGGEGTFNNLVVNENLTLANADGSTMGLVLGETLLTASGTELNYLDGSTPGSATASNALVLDASKNITGINSLSATNLTGTLQTAAQPNVTSVGTLTSLSVAGDVTVGSTVLSESEVAVLDGVVAGTVTASKAVVVDANKDISTFRNLTALNLIGTNVTGTLQTAAQPNVTSVGELTSLDVAGDVNVGGNLNVGGTFISQSEIVALDQAVPGTATATKAMVTDSTNSIGGINSLAATNLTGTLQTAAQPNVTSVGELTSLDVAGDVNVGGNLSVGGTFISEAEIIVIDAATPGHALPLKAMITDANNSIDSINSLSATSLTGTIQTAAQPNISSVNVLDVTAHDGATQGLKLGGVLITSTGTELNYVDTTAGHAQASKALVLDASKNIDDINNVTMNNLSAAAGSFSNTTDSSSTSTGAVVVSGGVGIAKALYVGTDASVGGSLVVENTSNLIGNVSVSSADESTSEVTGSITTAGGIGVGKSIFVAGNSSVVGNVSVTGTSTQAGVSTLTNATQSTSTTNGSFVTAGGVGIAKNINVGGNASVGGTFAVNGTSQLTGDVTLLTTTDSTSIASGSIVTAGGVGIAKNVFIGEDVSVGGDVSIVGSTSQSGVIAITNLTDSSSVSSGSLTTAGGVGIAKNLTVGGLSKITDATDSLDIDTGALVVSGGVGIGGRLNVGGDVSVDGDVSMTGNMVLDGGFTSSAVILTPADPTTSVFEIKAVSEYVLNETGSGYQWNNGSTDGNAGIQLMQLDSDGLVVNTVGHISDVTDSTSSTTGAFTVAGGVGIAKNLNVGANTSLSGTLSVAQASTLSGVTTVSNTTDSSSISTGAFVTTGGVGIAKNLNVGVNASVGGDMSIGGAVDVTGAVTLDSVAESSSVSTGSLVTAGGVGIAKKLYVGSDAYVGGAFDVTGSSSLNGDVSVISTTQSTSATTGSLKVAGGVGVSKNINVGENATIAGDFSVGGASDFTGSVSIDSDIDSVSTSTGSFVTAGGAGIAKNLNVGGTIKLSNTTPSTTTDTGALVVDGGVGVASDINVGGDVGVHGDLNLLGDFVISGKFKTTNVSLVPDAASPFSTLPLTTIHNESTILSLNKNVGVGYIYESAAVVSVPSLVTTNSVVYYATNSGSTWTALAMSGDALSTYNSTYSDRVIVINQLVVSKWSGKIWLAGALTKTGSSVGVVFSGDLNNGIDTLYTVGSDGEVSTCSHIAVATDDNNVTVIHKIDSIGSLYYMNITTSPTFNLVSSGSFVSVAWLQGLGKFVATRTNTSSIYCSTDSTGSVWVNGTTPSGVAPHSVVYNTTINLAVAVGSTFIWYSTNGVTWTNCNYASLSGGDVFNVVVNSPVSGLIAVYPNYNNTSKQLFYSTDAINWMTVAITETFGYTVPQTSSSAFGASNYAYAIGFNGSLDVLQKIGPITSATMIYEIDVESGYMKNESALGYQWYNNSTDTTFGDKLMELTTDNLRVETIVDVSNTTNSTSTNTGSIVTEGGVGIAKDLNVGANASIGGSLSIAGSVSQSGSFNVSDATDSLSTFTGAITTAGGVGIAKQLRVGGAVTLSSGLSVGGTSSLTGSVSVLSSTDSQSVSTGSLVTAGGVGIAKSLFVGDSVSVGADVTITGDIMQSGIISNTNATESSSTTSGSIVTSGGVGIAKSINVGNAATIGSTLDVTGQSTLRGSTSITNSTDSTSPTSGSLIVSGGVGIAKSLSVGANMQLGANMSVTGTSTLSGDVSVSSVTDSSSSTTGSFVTAGGVGIAKNINVGADASIGGTMAVTGETTLLNTTDALSATTGSFTTAGGVGIAKKLYVGSGIYGTIQTAAQPNISSVTVLNITGANGVDAGLSLNGQLVTANTTELNYLDGSLPGVAVASKALVFDVNKDISGIHALTADELTGTIQTASQPLITSVSTLNIVNHDGLESGLSLGGTLLLATAEQLNALVDGTSDSTFDNATVTNNLILSGANGVDTGLVIGTTLVTATGTELNYVDTTQGVAEPSKALVLNSDSDISGINSLSASQLSGTIQTAAQPYITSVTTLNITGHNGSSAGLSLNGVLVTSTADELNYLDTTAGSAQASKALVFDSSKNISGINSLSATSLTGTLQTASQPNITQVGNLISLTVDGELTIGSTVLSESDLLKMDGITNGTAAADKALVLDSNKNINGINNLGVSSIAIGSPSNTELPLEIGTVAYQFNGQYAYTNGSNAHGMIEAGMGTLSNYSLRTDGKILVTGEVQVTSDKRLKTNITPISLDVAKQFVMESKPIRFNWKNGDDVPELGFIAQEVYKINSDLVTITPHPGMEEIIDDDGFVNPANAKFTLATGKIIPLLTMTTKDLYDQCKDKDEKIKQLEDRLAKLEDIISRFV